jgi:DNA ligase-1
VLLSELVETSGRVASTRARNAKIGELAALLRRLDPDEAPVAVGFLSGEPRQGRIGIGWAALRDAAAGTPAAAPSLTLGDVDAALEAVGAAGGRGSASVRLRRLAELFARATEAERDFLRRLLLGELRQGALAGLMAEAVAAAADIPAADVRRALLLSGDLLEVARAALAGGAPALGRFSLQLFRPLQPMLAQSAGTLEEALAGIPGAIVEWKIDGARVQVHREGDDVRVYSRRLNEVTDAVPELVAAVRSLAARRLVLDGEVVALRPDGTPRPFQITMRRFGRRLDVDALRAELPLSAFFFDLLHLDGEDLLDRPAEERLAALEAVAPAGVRVPRARPADPAEARRFLEDALARGHEGVMVKDPGSPYEAGRRGAAWLKVKPARTLDLVILAAEWGHGRRRGFLSNLHLGAFDPSTGGFVMLGKTFKGLTDEMLRWQTERLLELETSRDPLGVHVRPELVVEVAFSDVQASPRYAGGMALRFARVKGYRPDKRPEDADTVDAVRALLPV